MYRKKKPKSIGPPLMNLAEEDFVSSNIKFLVDEKKVLNISAPHTRYFLYTTIFRLLIDPTINDRKYPFAIFNSNCTWRSSEEIGHPSKLLLKKIYEEINKTIGTRGGYASRVKLIKPGTYLFHNLTDGRIHSKKVRVRVYTSLGGKLSEYVEGQIISHEGKLSAPKTFELIIEKESKKRVRIPAHILELLIFTNPPIFEDSPSGKFGQLSVEMLKRGHVCRPEVLGGYILDCCNLLPKPKLLFLRLVGKSFEVPKELTPGNKHDEEIKELINKYGQ